MSRLLQLLILNLGSSVHSGSVVDSDLFACSLVDSQSESKVELDSTPSSATNSGFLADFDFATGFDFAAEEHSRHAILRLAMGSSQNYDQLWCSM